MEWWFYVAIAPLCIMLVATVFIGLFCWGYLLIVLFNLIYESVVHTRRLTRRK